MIKGLYFKLNLDNPKDKAIYDMFNEATKYHNVNKIDVLYNLCTQYYDEMMKTLLEVTK